jgi:DNA polymerase IIIc chi subunit
MQPRSDFYWWLDRQILSASGVSPQIARHAEEQKLRVYILTEGDRCGKILNTRLPPNATPADVAAHEANREAARDRLKSMTQLMHRLSLQRL